MAEAIAPAPLALSPAQVAFLKLLDAGPRAAARCQDAITVGSLIRLNLVAWQVAAPLHRSRRRMVSFALTPEARQFLAAQGEPFAHREAAFSGASSQS